MQDISSLQQDITKELTAALRSRLTGNEQQAMNARSRENSDAYRLSLQARYHVTKRTAEDLKAAIDFYEHAVAADPEYAEAHAGLAITYIIAISYVRGSAPEFTAMAEAAARRALALAPSLANSHIALGMARAAKWDWPTTEKEIETGIRLNPNDSNAHYFRAFMVLVPQKRFAEALTEYRRALELDPLSPIMNTNYGVALIINRQYDLAEAQFKHALTLDPNFGVLNLRMAQFHAFREDFEQAKKEFEKASGFIGKVNWQPGREGFYKALLAASDVTLDSEESLAAVAIGDNDRAIQSLERLAIGAPQDAAAYIRLPQFDPLHSEPRFLALLAHMNLQP
jgi:serine/threonine-protein kinase